MRRVEIAGLGTGRIEQLSSFAKRYAEAINVRFVDFYRYAIYPQFGTKSKVKYLQLPRKLQIEEMATAALQWVSALSSVANTGDAQFCTTLPLLGVVSGRGLVVSERRWCPFCLEEMADGDGVIFEPLIWRISESDCCTEHETTLESVCPFCARGSQSFLVANSRVGCCRYCGAWLGRRRSTASYDADAASVASAFLCGDLLSIPQAASEKGVLLPSRINVKRLNATFFCGRDSVMARTLGYSEVALKRYLRGEAVAPLRLFVRAALVTGASMREIFTILEPGDPMEDSVPVGASRSGCMAKSISGSGMFLGGARQDEEERPPEINSTPTLKVVSSPDECARDVGSRFLQVSMFRIAQQAEGRRVAFLRAVDEVVTELKSAGMPRPSVRTVKQRVCSFGKSLNPWERTVITCKVAQLYAEGESAIAEGPEDVQRVITSREWNDEKTR